MYPGPMYPGPMYLAPSLQMATLSWKVLAEKGMRQLQDMQLKDKEKFNGSDDPDSICYRAACCSLFFLSYPFLLIDLHA